MPIIETDFELYRSTLNSDTAAQNGGRVSAAVVFDNVKNNVFGDVPQSLRISGVTRSRKIFWRNRNVAGITLLNPGVFLVNQQPGDDFLWFRAGTHTETEAQLSVSARYYAVATLAGPASVGDSQIQIVLEHASQAAAQPFRVGDTIRLGATVNSGPLAGREEFVVVTTASTSGSTVTLGLDKPLTYSWSPSIGSPFVSGVYVPGSSLVASAAITQAVSTAGTYSGVGLAANPRGAVYQTWTLTFTDNAGNFRLDGDTMGSSIATGSRNSDFAPTAGNPFGYPYFSLAATGWGGTWAQNDSLVIQTTPGDVPIWVTNVVPAGAGSIAGDVSAIRIKGESGS